jgi:hypothetical protein
LIERESTLLEEQPEHSPLRPTPPLLFAAAMERSHNAAAV